MKVRSANAADAARILKIQDETLTHDSERFHSHLDFMTVGEFHKCGYKFGRWYNMIWMEKIIGEHC